MIFNFGKNKKEKAPSNIDEVINEVLALKRRNSELEKKIKKIEEEKKKCLQNWSMVRFNPFQDEGGKQSFSLAVVDDFKNGFVVTALYTKEGSRVYGKPIKQGESEYSLSVEEKKAINEAVKNLLNRKP